MHFKLCMPSKIIFVKEGKKESFCGSALVIFDSSSAIISTNFLHLYRDKYLSHGSVPIHVISLSALAPKKFQCLKVLESCTFYAFPHELVTI